MQQWKQELLDINTSGNHQKTIKTVLEAFLTSDYANCKNQRIEAIMFFNHINKLF